MNIQQNSFQLNLDKKGELVLLLYVGSSTLLHAISPRCLDNFF